MVMTPDAANGRAVFIDQLMRDGFSDAQSQSVYLSEMKARTLFDFSGVVP
jgi:hypothetical protein